MSLLQPWGLLAALTVPLILILYMLKRKSRLEPVSSTLLWEKLEQFISPAINISRLRRNLLFFLQLAAALLLALSLARPAINWAGAGAGAGTTIVIVDTSISMAVQDLGENETRLERAKQQIRDLVTSKGPREQVALVGMAEQGSLISGISTENSTLLKSIENITITGAEANLDEALVVVENIARSQEEPALIIISDGHFSDSQLKVDFPVTYLPIGQKRVENLLIEDMVADGERLYLTLRNNGTVPSRGVVQIKDSQERAVGQREVELPPGESTLLIWRELAPSPWYRGEISSSADQLALDNYCFTVSGQQQKSRLLLVTAGNLFLERALALQPSLSITRVKPEHYQTALAGEYDLFVFDGYLPENLPRAPVLAFDPPHPNHHFKTSPPAAAGPLLPPSHRLLSHVDLVEVRISFSKFLSGGQPLLQSPKGTLGAEYSPQGQPLIAFGFALQAGDLPLRPAFPILIRNIIDYFTGLDLKLGQFAYGQPLIINPPYQADEITVGTPGGEIINAAAPFPYQGPLLLESGIYTVSAGGEPAAGEGKGSEEPSRVVAVNPPVSTKPLTYRDSIKLNGEPVAGGPGHRTQAPVYTPLLLITLLLVGLEWWVDNRGY